MYDKKTELIVGIFLLTGIFSLFYLSYKLGKIEYFSSKYFTISAQFDSITGLQEGAPIELAGVSIGKVKKISLKDDMALVEMNILTQFKISNDSIASIRTKGIIGDKFIKITPGGSEEYFVNGDSIFDTESAISLEELVSKYIFEKE